MKKLVMCSLIAIGALFATSSALAGEKWNKTKSWAGRAATKGVVYYATGEPIRYGLERRGYYCPPHRIYNPVPAPVWYTATCARRAR
jgi:hypothetical protein